MSEKILLLEALVSVTRTAVQRRSALCWLYNNPTRDFDRILRTIARDPSRATRKAFRDATARAFDCHMSIVFGLDLAALYNNQVSYGGLKMSRALVGVLDDPKWTAVLYDEWGLVVPTKKKEARWRRRRDWIAQCMVKKV